MDEYPSFANAARGNTIATCPNSFHNLTDQSPDSCMGQREQRSKMRSSNTMVNIFANMKISSSFKELVHSKAAVSEQDEEHWMDNGDDCQVDQIEDYYAAVDVRDEDDIQMDDDTDDFEKQYEKGQSGQYFGSIAQFKTKGQVYTNRSFLTIAKKLFTPQRIKESASDEEMD